MLALCAMAVLAAVAGFAAVILALGPLAGMAAMALLAAPILGTISLASGLGAAALAFRRSG